MRFMSLFTSNFPESTTHSTGTQFVYTSIIPSIKVNQAYKLELPGKNMHNSVPEYVRSSTCKVMSD